jgi:hypothetical protein
MFTRVAAQCRTIYTDFILEAAAYGSSS